MALFPPNVTGVVNTGLSLSEIRADLHEQFIDNIQTIYSEDEGAYKFTFDALLGGYCSGMSLVKFLETGLSVAAICIEYPDLDRTRTGVIQLRRGVPSIAQGGTKCGGSARWVHISRKIDKFHLCSNFDIQYEALKYISQLTLDPTPIDAVSGVNAFQHLIESIRALLDAFERGIIHKVLSVLINKSIPVGVLDGVNLFTKYNVNVNKINIAAVLRKMKEQLKQNMFFVDKMVGTSTTKKLFEIVYAVTPSVTTHLVTHRAGDVPVDGVIVTTDNVRETLLALLPAIASEASMPAAYGQFKVTGPNVVTAVVMGKVVRGFQDIARNVLKINQGSFEQTEVSSQNDIPSSMTVPATIIRVGKKAVFLEALEHIYQSTDIQYPLKEEIDLSFVIPLGFFKQAPFRYSKGSALVRGAHVSPNTSAFPPKTMYFYDKSKKQVQLSLLDMCGTLCHPCVTSTNILRTKLPKQIYPDTLEQYVYTNTVDHIGVLETSVNDHLNWLLTNPPRLQNDNAVNSMTADAFMKHDNKLLQYELHPLYNVFESGRQTTAARGEKMAVVTQRELGMRHRLINGNIPLPLMSADFRLSRGLEMSSDFTTIPDAVIQIIRNTVTDDAYPVLAYMVEAAIHGTQAVFLAVLPVVISIVTSYWNNSRRCAFINSYPMVHFIVTHLGNGEIPQECFDVYKHITDLLKNIRSSLEKHSLALPNLAGHTQEQLNNIISDPMVLPPFLYNNITVNNPDFARVRNSRDFNMQTNDGDVNFTQLTKNDIDVTQSAWEKSVNHLPAYERITAEHLVLSKIFYWCFIPAATKGKCCGAGVRYNHVYITMLTHLQEYIQDPKKADPVVVALFENKRIQISPETLSTLPDILDYAVEKTSFIKYNVNADPGYVIENSQAPVIRDFSLYNGILMFNHCADDKLCPPLSMFYRVPFHGYFADAKLVNNIGVTLNSAFQEPMPAINMFGAPADRILKAPMVAFVKKLKNVHLVTGAFALAGCYFKLSAVGLIQQGITGFHFGLAATVVRQDRFLTDMLLYSERASESMFFGRSQMSKAQHPEHLEFNVTQEHAHIDMGLGFTVAAETASIDCALTDMSNMPQNLFNLRSFPKFSNNDVHQYIRDRICTHNSACISAPRYPLELTTRSVKEAPFLESGQRAICEFIITPVTSDLRYYQSPCNPRGRAGCVLGCTDNPEAALYDHTQPDPAYPTRATNNPWASQRFSLGDILYNTAFNIANTNTLFSPSAKFFTTSTVLSNNKSFSQALAAYSTFASSINADTSYQLNGVDLSRELTKDPCAYFQECYPILSASDPSLFDRPTNAVEVQLDAQYFNLGDTPLPSLKI